MFQALLRPFRTAARLGETDRQVSFPAPGTALDMIDGTSADAGQRKPVTPRAKVFISDAEEKIDSVEARYWAPLARTSEKAEVIEREGRKIALQLSSDQQRLAEKEHPEFSAYPPERAYSDRFTATFLAFLTLGEVGFNIGSFRRFGYSQPDSLQSFLAGGWNLIVIASLVSALLPFFGHAIGIKLKQHKGQRMPLTTATVFAVLIVATGALTYLLTTLRMETGEVSGAGLGTFVTYGAVNFGCVVAGMYLGYVNHFSDPDLENAMRRRKVMVPRLGKLDDRYSKLAGTFNPKLIRLKAKVAGIRDRAETLHSEYAVYNLNGVDAAAHPEITGVVSFDHFRERELDRAVPLSAFEDIFILAGLAPANDGTAGETISQEASNENDAIAASVNNEATTETNHNQQENLDVHSA